MSLQAFIERRSLQAVGKQPPQGRARRPSAAQRLLSPQTWAPAVAAKLRAGEPLDEWERMAAAEALEYAAGIGKEGVRRGRRKSVDRLRAWKVYSAVMAYRQSHPRAALSEDKTFGAVASLFSNPPSLVLTPAIVRKDFYAELKRRKR